MSDRANIALACVLPAERASVSEWLMQAGYDPVAMADLSRLDDNLQTNAIEALVADRALVPHADDVSGLLRRLGGNRPLVMLGDAKKLPNAMMGDLNVVPRPLTRDALLLSVALALAEGRPARRFPRRSVEPIPGTAHGMAITVFEASVGGVGIELVGARPSVLPPYFNLRIPDFGVHVLVKRAWMGPVSGDIVRCGGTVEANLEGAIRPWSEFAREAPAPVSSVTHRMAKPWPRQLA